MRWFHDLKISIKIALTFGLLLMLTCALGVFALLQIQKVNQSTREMADNWLPSVQTALEIEVALSRARANQLLRLSSVSREDVERYGKHFSEQIAQVDALLVRFVPLAMTPEEKVNLARVREAFDKYRDVQARVVKAYEGGQHEEGLRLMRSDGARFFTDVFDSAGALVRINAQGAKDADGRAEDVYRASLVMIAILLASGLLLGALLAAWLARIVGTPLQQAVRVAGSVARGDLTVDIAVRSKDESGQLMASLKDMNDGLLRVVTRVRSGTDTIATAADQIASGNADLSVRTEQQAGSLEETVSSIEQLTTTVGKNADNAREASRLAASASKVAQAGGAVVSQVVDTMESINDSSQKVADIVSVIDGIAFQTNILALNAAVEAARAGEQGRGFAVVASEVRSLAQRSSSAAREIKALIGDSVEKVESGTRLVAQAGATMTNIVASVRQVSEIVEEIAQASQEQSSGIANVNAAIARIDETTTQNAALVEQAAAAAQSLKEQAGQLTQVVGTFKLDAARGHKAAVAPVAISARAPAPPLRAIPAPAAHKEET